MSGQLMIHTLTLQTRHSKWAEVVAKTEEHILFLEQIMQAKWALEQETLKSASGLQVECTDSLMTKNQIF